MEAIVKVVAAIAVGVPVGLFLLYVATRVVSKAFLRAKREFENAYSRSSHGPK